jgi:F0F1-type ATP synthase assembly protein I
MTENKPGSTVGSGWVASGSFLGSILSGFLLGYLADHWLGTEPWLVVIGIIAGSYSGFMRMWQYSKRMEEGPDYDHLARD